MRGGTLFSGIAAPEVAMPWVDWRWCAEIDPFASAVLAARFPDVPNLGDVTRINPDAVEPVDLVVFGSPCQSFSVAGGRLGLDDPRGNLALIALRLIGRIRPKWVVFENVPGLLSSDGGRDFGAFLGLLGECGYGFAFRIFDAQYAGVPQRRRRVFVVGYLGDWRPPAAVLFEQESLRGNTAPRRAEGQRIAPTIEAGANRTGGPRPPGTTVDTADRLIAFDARQSNVCVYGDRGDGFNVGEDGAGRGTPLVAAFHYKMGARAAGIGYKEEQSPVLDTYAEIGVFTLAIRGRGDSHDLEYREDGIANAILTPNGGRAGIGVGAVAFCHVNKARQAAGVRHEEIQTFYEDVVPTLQTDCHSKRSGLIQGMSIRRLTPVECARLQGFPDDYLDIVYRGKPAADGNKYRALGNSMCIQVVSWLGQRIRLFEEVTAQPSPKGHAA